MRANALMSAVLLLVLAGADGAAAAVRNCAASISSGAQSASSLAQAQKLAIAGWAKAAAIAHDARFTSWRVATTKSLTCHPAATSGVVCEARAVPCVIEQAPANARPILPKAPEPKVIPVPQFPAKRKPIDT